ncbi:nuclear transport factor 2 family protein [Devosia sp.]|uniref:nuclear transport factor 2 family protein n=1 Tax=Devosia sp. TaxID=1871048 RepID=UPI003262FC40
MAERLAEKVCAVVVRGVADALEVLVFRHPLAGVQIVKGTREAREAIVAGALRELAEEAGIVEGVSGALLCSSSAIVPGQLWHFVLAETASLPESWTFDTADDGGHRFEFFWWRLDAEPDFEWQAEFVRALHLVREAVGAMPPKSDAVMMLSRYAECINTHCFDDVAALIDQDAVFWFGDGSHEGLPAIRAGCETTWHNLVDEIYWLEDVRWIASSVDVASCIYRFHWQAIVGGECRAGSGRGTSVLAWRRGRWKIIHEHLSALPG